jgi:glutathione S-transferase
MLLYSSFGPNPRAVRMFLAEKGIALEVKELDILKAENRRPPYIERNPAGQIPALELDNGRCIGETVAIFEYLEEKHPVPPLIGTTPEERAETRQWQRRVELNITENLYNGFRYGEGIDLFKTRIPVVPEASAGLKRVAQERLKWLDALIAGRQFIVGDRFTIADIILYCALDFGSTVGQKLDPARGNVGAWFRRVETRPSAVASLHPMAAKIGRRG